MTDERPRENERREALRLRQELIATPAHQLRNPLAPLRTGIELLRNVREQPHLLDTVPPMMERQIRELVALIDRLPGVFGQRSTDTIDQCSGTVACDGLTR